MIIKTICLIIAAFILIFFVTFILPIISFRGRYPVAVYHGMWDTCETEKMIILVAVLKYTLKTYVKYIDVRGGEESVSIDLPT